MTTEDVAYIKGYADAMARADARYRALVDAFREHLSAPHPQLKANAWAQICFALEEIEALRQSELRQQP